MNKSYLISSILSLSLLTGCTTTTALNHFTNDTQSAYAIHNTKKGDLNFKNENRAMIFATYLNNINKKYETEKLNSFVIGLHLANQDNHELEKNGYKVLLNGNEAMSITTLDTDSKLVQSIPLKNNWANYYLVHFKNNDEIKTLNITLSHSKFGQTALNFQK
jgi:hypothetical protein